MNKSSCGVPGTLTRVPGKDGLWKKQKWTSERRTGKDEHGDKVLMHAEIRYDDQCGNGHNSFALTGHGWYDHFKARDWDFGGCCHEKIAKVFPELEHLIKWHLCNSDGPTFYIVNTVYLAGDLDHRGKRKGEPWAWDDAIKFGNFPITKKLGSRFAKWLEATLEYQASTPKTNPRDLEIIEFPHSSEGRTYSPKYSFDDFCDKWHECPFDTRHAAEQFKEALSWGAEFLKIPTLFSEGKERQLDAARRAAVWPGATDEQLCLPKEELTKLLERRLPDLLDHFQTDVTEAGFAWEPAADEAQA